MSCPPWERMRRPREGCVLERPAHQLHCGWVHLCDWLRQPSVEMQLHAIVDDANRQALTPEGLDAVLGACERAMAGHSRDQIRQAGWDELVLGLIPVATDGASSTKAANVRLRVSQWPREGR